MRILKVIRTFEINNFHGVPETPVSLESSRRLTEERDTRMAIPKPNASHNRNFAAAEVLGYFNIEEKGDDFFTLE